MGREVTPRSSEEPSAGLVALGWVCTGVLVPSQCCRGGPYTHTCAYPGAYLGGSRVCQCHVSCPLELGRNNWGKSKVSNSRGPAFPELPARCTAKGPSPFASAARSASPHQRQGSLLPCNSTRTRAFLCIPPFSRDAGTLPPLHHAPSWTTAWRTSWVAPRSSNTAAFNTRFLLPLVLSLGHLWLLLLGTV